MNYNQSQKKKKSIKTVIVWLVILTIAIITFFIIYKNVITKVTIDNIVYKLHSDGTAEIIKSKGELRGDIKIPSEIKKYGNEYKIVKADIKFQMGGVISIKFSEGIKKVSLYKGNFMRKIILPSSLESFNLYSITSRTYTGYGSKIPYYNNTFGELNVNEYNQMCFLGNEENPYLVLIRISDDFNQTDVDIPEGTKIIMKEAFAGAKCIQNISTPKTLLNVEKDAFYDCKCEEISSFDIPIDSQLKYLDGLSDFTNIKHIYIPKNLETVDLTSMIGLQTISVSEENGKYDSRNDCNALIETSTNTLLAGTSISTIPNTVSKIGNKAFYGRTLSNIEIPSSIKTIGDCAFQSCKNVSSVNIAEGVTKIGEKSFNFTFDSVLEIPDTVEEIGEDAFSGIHKLIVPFIGKKRGNNKKPRNKKEIRIEWFGNLEYDLLILKTLKETVIHTEAMDYRGAWGSNIKIKRFCVDGNYTIKVNAFSKASIKETYISSKVKNIERDTFCGVIYCEDEQLPAGWSPYFATNIIWGYSYEEWLKNDE